jgi:hypothetical protein
MSPKQLEHILTEAEEAKRDELYRKQVIENLRKFIDYKPVPYWGTTKEKDREKR